MRICIFINRITFLVLFLFCTAEIYTQQIPLGQDVLVAELDQELSGETAKRNLEFIAGQHRMRGSEGYNEATEFILNKLEKYQLEGIELIQIPTNGTTMYGTQKSRSAWNVEFAELWEVEEENGHWKATHKIADWQATPLVVAQDSESGEVTAELIDIGTGTNESDYSNKNIKGKLVLTSSQPEAVVPLAIEKYGAAGIISYAQNQKTAWWKENDNLIRWGHLNTFSKTKTFAFMISLRQARNFQQRLSQGKIITFHAKVIAGQNSGAYNILTAVIEGSDPSLKDEEIAFTCHLDHPRPGANDNASGSAAILEVARTLKKLIDEGKLDRPKRTIRFIWSPEIEGTTSLLNFKPTYATHIKFNIHMDMVGGGPETKAIFHVSRSPQSLPNFMMDVGAAFGNFVNESSDAYAGGSPTQYPLVSETGGKEALQASIGEFHMGSDFQVFNEGSFRIPSIYLHDWPDRYIHTNYDVAANIDPTKLKRSSFIGAASAYYLANLQSNNGKAIIDLMKQQVLIRSSDMLQKSLALSVTERENAKYYFWISERANFNSLAPYVTISPEMEREYDDFLEKLKSALGAGKMMESADPNAAALFNRNDTPKGPMTVFGYDYFVDHYDSSLGKPELFNYNGLWGSGGEYAYEALNFVDGTNNVLTIRNKLSAEFGPIPMELVYQYLLALESIQVIARIK